MPTTVDSSTPRAERVSDVVLRGLDIPFFDLVVLLVKVALAAIPALVILAAVGAVMATGFAVFFSGFLAALLGS